METVGWSFFGFAGIAALTWTSPDGEIVLSGVAALLISGAAWAAGSLYNRRTDLPADPFVALNFQLLMGGVMTVPLVILGVAESDRGLTDISWTAWAGITYLASTAVIAFLATG